MSIKNNIIVKFIIIASILLCTTIYTYPQTTIELPSFTVYNKNNETISLSKILPFGSPILLLTYSQENCSACLKSLDSLDLTISQNPLYGKLKIMAINQDVKLSSMEVFNFASRWKNIQVLLDKNNEIKKSFFLNNESIFLFLDENKKIITAHKIYESYWVSTILMLAERIQKGEIKSDKVYYNNKNFPCLPNEAAYYTKIRKDPSNKWIVESYYLSDNLKSKAETLFPKPLVLHGKYISYFDRSPSPNDMQIESEGEYYLNKKTGIFKKYYRGKLLREQVEYKDGKLNGVHATYYENGKLSTEGDYINNDLVDEFKYYYRNGNLARIFSVNMFGLQDGACKSWYPSGKPYYSFMFNNGEIDYSTLTCLRENGEKLFEYFPGKDKENFTLDFFYNKMATIKYEFSADTIKALFYYINGNKSLKFAKFSYGRSTIKPPIEGKNIEWYGNGKQKIELNFKKGKPIGKGFSWHENGKIFEILDFDTNETKYFDSTGNKISKPQSDLLISDINLKIALINQIAEIITQFYGELDENGNIREPVIF